MFKPSNVCSESNFSQLFGEIPVSDITLSTDSRSVDEGQMFIGLVGEKFDGGKYLLEVCKKGASMCVVQDSSENRALVDKCAENYPGICLGVVENATTFLQDIAKNRINEWKKNASGIVIGITGSNGKTTNKEILFHILNSFRKNQVYATEGNFNNFIGVPLSILRLSDSHKYAILEMGTSLPGEIELLAKIGCPDIGYVTNIGNAHIEFLHSKEGVFEEKTCLFKEVEKSTNAGSFNLINAEDEYLKNYEGTKNIYVGQGSEEFPIEYNKNGFSLSGESFSGLALSGFHNYLNYACCSVLALKILDGVSLKEIAVACSGFRPQLGRSQIFVVEDRHIYFDAYNANPDSMEASLSSFENYLENAVGSSDEVCFYVGDMNELGKDTETYHMELGKHLKNLGAKKVIFVGRYAPFFLKGFPEASSYADVAALINSQNLDRSKFIFMKASRSVQLEKLLPEYGVDVDALWKKS